jgi:hypothetical protein
MPDEDYDPKPAMDEMVKARGLDGTVFDLLDACRLALQGYIPRNALLLVDIKDKRGLMPDAWDLLFRAHLELTKHISREAGLLREVRDILGRRPEHITAGLEEAKAIARAAAAEVKRGLGLFPSAVGALRVRGSIVGTTLQGIPDTEENRVARANKLTEIEELKRAVRVLEGLQALREELKKEKMDGHEPYSDREGAMQYGEGFERGMENALEKLESLLGGT